MKTNSCSRILYFIFIGVISLGLYACSSSTDPYEPYIGNGEQVYPSKSDSIAAYPGKNRAILTIAKPVDPHVKEVGIFWRNETDSLKLEVPQSKDTLRVEIDNLQVDSLKTDETYVFKIYTYDKEGNRSVGRSITANVYNDNYANSITNRTISNLEFDPARGTIINWELAYPEMIGSIVKYTNQFDETDSVFVPADSDNVVLSDNNISQKITYESLYKPDSMAIDTFYTAPQETRVKKIFLKNATAPISPATINTNFLGGKFGTPAHWTVNEAARNLPGDVGGWRNDNTLCIVTFPGKATLPKNGKIYKTLTLPKGSYSIDVDFYEIQNQYKRYIVAAKGNSIPNIKKLNSQTIAYSEVVGTGFDIDTQHLKFSLTKQTKVSFGFVFNMNVRNANFAVSNFYLNYSSQ